MGVVGLRALLPPWHSTGPGLVGYATVEENQVGQAGLSAHEDMLAVMNDWVVLQDNVRQLPASWNLSRFPRLLKNHGERLCDDFSQVSEDSWMYPIRPYRFAGTQLEQKILHKFVVNIKFFFLAAMVLKVRSLTPPWIHVEDRGKECIKHLCLAPVSVYILIL
ncbi:hypothetical protein TURU_062598 [Turdus rufiventris]|nr:hypothetical protein TURU_062598 [Turdus rufiventris]